MGASLDLSHVYGPVPSHQLDRNISLSSSPVFTGVPGMNGLHSDNRPPPAPTRTYTPVLPGNLEIKHGGDKLRNNLSRGPTCCPAGSHWFFKATNDHPLDFRLNVK